MSIDLFLLDDFLVNCVNNKFHGIFLHNFLVRKLKRSFVVEIILFIFFFFEKNIFFGFSLANGGVITNIV